MTVRYLTLIATLFVSTLTGCSNDDVAESSADGSAPSATKSASDSSSSSGAVAFDPDKPVLDSIPVRTPEGTPARFGWKSGHIILRYSGGIVGKREIYFTDWGMRERRLDSTEPGPSIPGPKQYTLLISTAERFTMIDLPLKEGWTMINDSDEKYLSSDSSKKFSLGELIFRSSGGARRPDEVVDGVKVGVLEMAQTGTSTKIWVRQGLVVKEHFKGKDGAGFTVEPVLMEFNIDVPESMFAIPPGMKIQERRNETSVGPPGGPPPRQAPPPGMTPPVMPPPGGGRPPVPGGAMPMPMPAPGGR